MAEFEKTFNKTGKKESQNILKDKKFMFFLKRPNFGHSFGHRGIPPRPKAQSPKAQFEGIEIEIDRVHIWGVFDSPEVYTKLGGDYFTNRLVKDIGFGQIVFYSSGLFDAYLDLSDPLNERIFWSILGAIQEETGCKIVEVKLKEGETTLNVDRYSELGEKIAKAIGEDVKMLITKGQQVKTYFKEGIPIELSKYRIESSSWAPVYDTFMGYLEGRINLQEAPTIFLLVSPVQEEKINQTLVAIQEIEKKVSQLQQQVIEEHKGITAALNSITTYLTNHDIRMIEEHQLILEQNREILRRLDALQVPTNFENQILEQITEEPKTISEIANSLGISYHTCYYHIRNLAQRGIIQFEIRRTGRRGRPRKVFFRRR